MFDVFFGLQARCFFRRLFIAGPLECVESCEVRKFFETEANRLEPPAKNGRHHFRSGNPTPNIEGQLESDVVDALNNFHHRQFIFAKFNRSPVNNRLVNYFNRLIWTELLFACKMAWLENITARCPTSKSKKTSASGDGPINPTVKKIVKQKWNKINLTRHLLVIFRNGVGV